MLHDFAFLAGDFSPSGIGFQTGGRATNRTDGAKWNTDRLQLCIQPGSDPQLYRLLSRLNWILLLPLCLVGALLNLVALICLHRPPKIASGVFVYLTVLLAADIAQLLTTATQVIPFGCDHALDDSYAWHGFCVFYRRYVILLMPRVVATVDTIHLWSITALSAHRFWKVSNPMLARMHDTRQRAAALICGLVAAAVLFRLPMFLELHWHVDKSTGRSRIDYRHDFVHAIWYNVAYYVVANGVCFHLLPCVAMTLFGALTLRCLRAPRHPPPRRSSVSRQSTRTAKKRGGGGGGVGACVRKETRATISILLMVGLFLAFHCLSVYEMTRRWVVLLGGPCHTRVDFLLVELSIILSMVSATLNAFIFIAVTNKVKSYLESIRRKSRGSGSSEAVLIPLPSSPKFVVEPANFEPVNGACVEDTQL